MKMGQVRRRITRGTGAMGGAPPSRTCAIITVTACPAVCAQRRRVSHWMLTQLRSGIAAAALRTTFAP
jgi:hypothetical protein